jgi:cytochrome c-type biogenesis protein CcmH
MWRQAFITLFVVLLASGPLPAVQPDEILKDSVLESRARNLSRELRCMVCQNQSIDDSEAPLARDLRLLVRERLIQGDTDQQVLDFLVSRYGNFVLLRPPLEWHTILLWGLPPAALIAGLIAGQSPQVLRSILRERSHSQQSELRMGLSASGGV